MIEINRNISIIYIINFRIILLKNSFLKQELTLLKNLNKINHYLKKLV